MKNLINTLRLPHWLALCLLASAMPASAQETDGTQTATAAPLVVLKEPGDAVAAPDAEEPPAKPERRAAEIVRFFTDTLVGPEDVASELVVIGASATIQGKVRGDAVVVMGNAELSGEVGGALVVPLGSVKIGPGAHVKGDLVVVGGTAEISPEARIDGERVEVTWPQLEQKLPFLKPLKSVWSGVKSWGVQGLLLGRPLPHGWGWWWPVALVLAVVYLLTGVVFARPVAGTVAAIQNQPLAALLAGLVGYVTVCVLFLLLAATGIGVLALPFLLGALLVISLFGSVAVYQGFGCQVGRQLGVALLARPLAGLALGIAVFYLLYMIPLLGCIVWTLAAPMGFGAVLIAVFGSLRRDRLSSPPASGPPVTPDAGATSYHGADAPSPSAPPPISPGGAGTARALSAAEIESLPRGGFWIRCGATLLDLLIVGALLSLLGLGPLFLLVWIAYHVAMWSWKGTTVGGVVFGLQVVRRDARPLTFAVGLVRSLSALLSALALFLGFFWVGWSREKLSWHDIIAGTVIVRVPRGISLV